MGKGEWKIFVKWFVVFLHKNIFLLNVKKRNVIAELVEFCLKCISSSWGSKNKVFCKTHVVSCSRDDLECL